MNLRSALGAAALVLTCTTSPWAAEPTIRVSVGGEIRPGVYGQIELGNAPPPPVLYPQPVVIVQPPRAVVYQPVYMHVPPGHAKRWSRYCGRYGACGRPVYFVKSVEYEPRRDKGHGPRGHRHRHGADD